MIPRLSLPASDHSRDAPPAPVSGSALAFLNHLRFVAMACRVKPRAHLFEACALLQTGPTATRQAYSDALMRCLGEALGQTPRVLAPGTAERTFDEDWLIALGRACAGGDAASATFLLARRVPRAHRRLVRFLVGRVAQSYPDF